MKEKEKQLLDVNSCEEEKKLIYEKMEELQLMIRKYGYHCAVVTTDVQVLVPN